jgi:plasmid replication initiation protein
MELAKVEENKNNIVVKHQELVHNARYRLSELGIKVLSVLISMIKTSDTEFTQYAIQIKDFKELIHSDSKNTYKYAHKLISELMSNPMQIGDEQFNWASYGKYHRGDGVVVFEIHRLLKPYLLELQKNFLQYNITNILPLKSGYVIRLYELCKDHFNEARRYKESATSVTFEMKIDRLRENFHIPDSYQYSSHIKKHILDKAVEQFRSKTDIKIEYEEQKIGRRVDRVLITVRENNRGSNDYMKSKQAFIRYMRANFVNADVLVANDTKTNKQVMISIAPDGKLYDKRGSEFDAKRSNEIWDSLFKLSQEDKLLCLKQGTLF